MGCKRDLYRAKLDESCDFVMRKLIEIVKVKIVSNIAKTVEK